MRSIVIIVISFITNICLGQDPQLIGNVWYLDKIDIGGMEYFPPDNGEIDNVNLDFAPDTFGSMACNLLSADVSEYTGTTISTSAMIVLDGPSCNLPSTYEFEGRYFEEMYQLSSQINTYSYIIEDGPNDTLKLTITNDEGNFAVYGNTLLAQQDLLEKNLLIYPVPVKEVLQINSPLIKIKHKVVYDMSGRIIIEDYSSSEILHLGSLKAGVYILEISTDQGKLVKKILVE